MSLRSYIRKYRGKIDWITRYKERIPLDKLGQSHLMNCIRMVNRQIEDLYAECTAAYGYSGNGEMAQYHAEIAAEHAQNKAMEKVPILEVLRNELLARRHKGELVKVHDDLVKRLVGPDKWEEYLDYRDELLELEMNSESRQ